MKYLLLSLLKDARYGVKSEPQSCDYEGLYHLAQEHQVSALIYNQIYHFSDLSAELKARWSRDALTINAFQAMRSNRFVQLYQTLRNGGVNALVVKGLILRNLYPQPDNRQSNDEDVYIPMEQFQLATQILQDAGAVLLHEGKYENAFLDQSCGLSIELHGQLFDPDTKIFGQYQQLFEAAFQTPAEHRIDGVPVLSLSHDLHFLFLMTHLAKHFMFSGVGIRQILDIVMYAEAYREEIHWSEIYQQLAAQNLLTLTANVMEIGRIYFDMDRAVPVPDMETDCGTLLDDILDAGVFGASSQARLHSASLTLAAADGQEKVSGQLLWKRLFPPLSELRERASYSYLRKKPWLLPCVWVKRIGTYLSHRESNQQEQDTLELGAQRVELLKKYGIIK